MSLKLVEGKWIASLKVIKEICPREYVEELPAQLNCTIQFKSNDLVEISEPSTEVESDQTYKCSYMQIGKYIFIRGSDFEDKVQERWILELLDDGILGEISIRDFTTNSFVVAQVSLVRGND